MAKPLSKKAEQQLLEAIDNICTDLAEKQASAAQLVEAAVKQATAFEFGPDMIRLMCYGWNNGAVANRRETSQGILQKTAAFPILDAEQVIDQVLNRETKEATVASDYLRAPVQQTRLSLQCQATGREKSAEQTPVEVPFEKRYGQAARLNEEIKAARSALRFAEEQLLHKIAQIGEYFKRDSTRQWLFDEVDYAVRQKHGSLAGSVMQSVADYNNYTVKAANLKPRKAVDWTKAPFTWVGEAIKLANDVTALQSEFVSTAMMNRYKIAKLLERVEEEAPQSKTSIFDQQRPEENFEEKLALLSGGLSDLSVIGGLLGTMAGGPPKSKEMMVDDTLNDLNDPVHDEQLRQIRTKAMLYSLLNNDSVLSSYKPQEVLGAYNNLSALAPRASRQPLLATSVLRRWTTQGGIEPFEAKEIGDIEKTLQQTQKINKRPSSADDKEASVLNTPRKSILD